MGFADPSRMDGNPQSFSEAVDEAEDDAAFAFDALPFAVLGFGASLLQMTLPHVEHRTVHASHMCLPHCEQVLQHQHWFPPWMPTWQYVPYHASSSSAS